MYYFASDMHLGLTYRMSSLERERMVVRWLDEVSADARAIFLVGDVFDFWFEWKRVIPRGFSRLLGKFSELTDRGIRIHFFTGNHDLWAYEYLHDECGLTLHHRAEVFELYGKEVFVAHGDNLYLKKPLGIRVMNHFFYSRRFWHKIFSVVVHPNQAMRFGLWWSNKSRKSKRISHYFAGEEEYLIQYARQYSRCVAVDYFIFGHLHTAVDYDMGDGRRTIVLGEWIVNPTYAVLKPDGEMELRAYGS